MAASLDTFATNTVSDGTALSLSMTISASATLAIVFVGWSETTPSANGTIISDIQIGGVSCTNQSQIVNGFIVDTWFLANPPTGTKTVTIFFVDAVTLGAIGGKVSAVLGVFTFLSTSAIGPIQRNTTWSSGYTANVPPVPIGGGCLSGIQGSFGGIVTASTLNYVVECTVLATSHAGGDVVMTVGLNQTQKANAGGNGANGVFWNVGISTWGTPPTTGSKAYTYWTNPASDTDVAISVVEVHGT